MKHTNDQDLMTNFTPHIWHKTKQYDILNTQKVGNL